MGTSLLRAFTRSPACSHWFVRLIFRRAFENFQRLYGVGSILDPDDPQCCSDEKANITYLAELMKAMPDRDVEDGEGAGRLVVDAPVADTRQVCR